MIFTAVFNANALRLFFVFNYCLILTLVARNLNFTNIFAEGWLEFSFLIANFLLYSALYGLPSYALTKLSQWLFTIKNQKVSSRWVWIIAIFTASITTLIMYANAKLFELYGMYINGFVINLVMTPGGVESLGGSTASDVSFAFIALGFLSLQIALMWLAHQLVKFQALTQLTLRLQFVKNQLKNWRFGLIGLLGVIILHMLFAYDQFTSNQLTAVSEQIPFYQTISSRNFFTVLGVKGTRNSKIKIKGRLNYPIHPLNSPIPSKPLNVVWLVSESWRADTLNAHIMPNTWQFSQQAARFTQNYSGGNGTRMGVFSMLMGMPGSYWFPFLKEQRGAAIIDVMQQQGYQMQFYTSAKFSYPEFEKTIFSQVPSAQLHPNTLGEISWKSDQHKVSDLLSFIEKRDPNKPFFTFMFFESPHARYNFPAESAIAQPYRDDLNYATLSKAQLRQDIVPIKNRYINSVHHLDTQFGRIFDYLKTHQLLENTIVIVVGDHGEEFMEHGFWGHNSTFVDEQVRTPLVIYAPKQAPRVSDALTSHMDIVPSIMPLLGVKNPTSDYSLGFNLFAGEKRPFTYLADWDSIAYVDHEVKMVFPVNRQSLVKKLTSNRDLPLEKTMADAMRTKKSAVMPQILKDLSYFTQTHPQKQPPVREHYAGN